MQNLAQLNNDLELVNIKIENSRDVRTQSDAPNFEETGQRAELWGNELTCQIMMKQVDVSNYEETVRLMSSPHENKQEKDLKKTTKSVNKWKITQI